MRSASVRAVLPEARADGHVTMNLHEGALTGRRRLVSCIASSAQGGKAEVQPCDIDGGTAPPEEVFSRPLPTEEPSGAKSSRKALAFFKSSVLKPGVKPFRIISLCRS